MVAISCIPISRPEKLPKQIFSKPGLITNVILFKTYHFGVGVSLPPCWNITFFLSYSNSKREGMKRKSRQETRQTRDRVSCGGILIIKVTVHPLIFLVGHNTPRKALVRGRCVISYFVGLVKSEENARTRVNLPKKSKTNNPQITQ